MVNKTVFLGWTAYLTLVEICQDITFLIRGFTCVLPSHRVTLNSLEGNPYPHKGHKGTI